MKNIYFLIKVLLLSTFSFGQVLITEIADPNNNSEARYIELYNMGSSAVDFTEGNGWQIDKYLNNNSGVNATIELTGTIPAGGFYIIAYNSTPGTFEATYGFVPDQLDSVANGVTGSNGDDDLALVDGNDNIVDFFGVYDFGLDVNTDNSGTCAEYEDGRAERLTTVTGPNPNFDESEWNIWADSTVSGCTSHQNAPRTAPGDFDPGAWGTPTCGLSLLNPSSVCDNITSGTDTYTATIDFIGGGNATYTVSADAGVVDLSGGNPSTDTTGTITVTGLTEGSDVVINVQDGGICDVTTTIFAPNCVPSINLPIYEGFDYPVGQNLSDQVNWDVFNTGDAILVGGPDGLTYTGLASSSQTGNHVIFDGDGAEAKIEFTAVTSGPVYASFLLNLTDISAITDLNDGGYIAALAASDSGYDARVWVRPNTDPVGTTYDIWITSESSATAGGPFIGSYNIGDTVLVVMSYNPTNGSIKGWINPISLGGSEPAPDFSETDSSPAAVIDRFVLRQDSAGETPFTLFDELRIGSTYAEVTPQTLSNDDVISVNFSLYPNPVTNGSVTISSNSADAMQVQVYDVLGKVVKSETLSNNMLDVSNLNTGLYIVKITQNQNSVTKKLVIK